MSKMSEIYIFSQNLAKSQSSNGTSTNEVTTGIVISPEPELTISLDENVQYHSDEIICLVDPLADYLRNCEIVLEGDIEQQYESSTLEPNDRQLVDSKGTFKFTGTGTIKLTDTLAAGDEVLCQMVGKGLVVWGKIKRGGS